MILASLALVNCAMYNESFSPEEDIVVTPVETEIRLNHNKNPGPDPCAPYFEVFTWPDGTFTVVEIPVECNPLYIDRGDPPPEYQNPDENSYPEIKINKESY
jgi:hypothetical protein